MLYTTNKKIAITPFEKHEVKSVRMHGLALMDHMVRLEKATVVFPSHDMPAGLTVYMHGESVKHKWATEVFEHDGKKFILAPQELVVAYENNL